MKGLNIMFGGSIILIVLVVLIPKEYSLIICIPFIIIQTMFAIYFTLVNQKRKK